MPYLLHIAVSPQGENSQSRALAHSFIASYKTTHPDTDVIFRDLAKDPVPHLDGETLVAGYLPEEARSDSQKVKIGLRLELTKEIIEADSVIVSTPMWNWSIPSVLKAYIDQIVYIGVLDPQQNRHLTGKRITILISTGGAYGPDSWHPEWDYESNYLKLIFSNLGATDIEVIRTEYTLAGVVPGMEELIPNKEQSLKDATVAAEVRAKAL